MTTVSDTSSQEAPGSLAGLRVLDLTRQIAGPYCTKLMADYGADVIKIEQPGTGDPARHLAPFFHDEPDPDGSLHFLYLNTSKRSVILDLKTDSGRQSFLDLAREADVVVESFRPGVLDSLGIGWETLHELNPRLILTSISNFGQTGPYRDLRASELVEYAMSGVMAISGREDRSPLKHGLSQSQYNAGACAAWVTAMATFMQVNGEAGQWIDVSLFETQVSTLVLNESYYAWLGGIQGRRPAEGDGTVNGLSDIMPCADGHVIVQVRQTDKWSSIVEFLEAPELEDERFETNEGRTLNAEPLYDGLLKALASQHKHELFHRAAKQRVLYGMVQNPSDLLSCPHLEARGYWVDVDHPTTGTMKYPGAPVRMPGTSWAVSRHAPLLGEHTDEVLGGGWRSGPEESEPPPAELAVNETRTKLPLEGIRVLDLSSVWAMPYAAGLMADLGAEVVKIEALQRLDSNRGFGVWPGTEGGREPWNAAGVFSIINRGKRSLTLNLAEEQGREVFRKLVKESDIVIENYTARVMRGWDLDFEHLREINPGIIMVSNTGYGHGGPWESYPVQGTALEATTGIPHFSGYAGGRPWTVGQSYPDFVAMWHGLFCMMTALRRRKLTGEGQWIDLGMYQANVSFQGEAMLDYVANGRIGERMGNRNHIAGVQGCYRALGDDEWFAVAAQTEDEWRALCGTLGTSAWGGVAVPDSLSDARARHDDLDRAIGAWAETRTREDIVEALRGAGLPAGPVNNARDLLLDPHLQERGLYEMLEHAPGTGIGRRPVIGRAYHLSDTAVSIRRPAPPLGEANAYIIKELLGISEEEFDALEAEKITGTPAPNEESISGLPIDVLMGAGRIKIHDPDYVAVLGIEVPE